jgi:perosamine synthetase
MLSQIGVWPPLAPTVYTRRPAEELAFPIEEPGCRLFSRARHGLFEGVGGLGLLPGDEVLVPGYHHGSEIEALARAGLACIFYDAETLEPNEDELDRLLSPRVRALYLVHYLGLPQDVVRWRAWCDARGLWLLEDAAQAWLAKGADGRPVGGSGDISIFCLYKTFGLADGAALLLSGAESLSSPSNERASAAGPLARRHLAWVAERSGLAGSLAGRLRRPRPYSAEEDFALGDPATPMSSTSAFLLRRVFDPGAAARRRANYALLLDGLGESVAKAFPQLADGASPFAFPLATTRKADLLERLAARGVRGVDFWSVPHPTLDPSRFPAATALRREVVALPVHQELTPTAVERIIDAASPRPKRRNALRIEGVEGFSGLQDAWTGLAEASGNIFATWEWNSIWWRHFGTRRALATYICTDSTGAPKAILPLHRGTSGGLRLVRFIGHRQADHLSPICAPHDRAVAATALRAALDQEKFDVFIGDKMGADEGWGALVGGRVLRRTGSPVIRYHGRSWEEFLHSRSANFREQVRRRERKLRREHELALRLCERQEHLKDDLATLFRLHAGRWESGDGTWFSESAAAFHSEFAACALDRGWLRLWILEVDGTPAAAWYGFRYGGAEFYYQAGRDLAHERSSVGFVLLAHTIREALEDGMEEYRFLEGAEPYKYRFATDDAGLETIGLSRGVRGGAALAAAATMGSHRGLSRLGRRMLS